MLEPSLSLEKEISLSRRIPRASVRELPTTRPPRSPEVPGTPISRSSRSCERLTPEFRPSSRNRNSSLLPPPTLKRVRSPTPTRERLRCSARLRAKANTGPGTASDPSPPSPRQCSAYATTLIRSDSDSFSDSSSEGSSDSDDEYTPGLAIGTDIGDAMVTDVLRPAKRHRTSRVQDRSDDRQYPGRQSRTWPSRTNIAGRSAGDVRAYGFASPPLSHVSSNGGSCTEGSTASFTEWPLQNALLKRVMENGVATFNCNSYGTRIRIMDSAVNHPRIGEPSKPRLRGKANPRPKRTTYWSN
ncbi:hypothetical protein V1527DRAFT_78284 [Lipomyces starkeyi]